MKIAVAIYTTMFIICANPVFALTKIIVTPTARTLGKNRYSLEITRRGQLLNAQALNEEAGAKFGVGDRVQLEVKTPIVKSASGTVFFIKYTFASADDKLLATAVGIDNIGRRNQAVPYIAVSRLFEPVDCTLGIAKDTNAQVKYFVGFDYRVGDKLHILTDRDQGQRTIDSAGFQYDVSKIWHVKSALEATRENGTNVYIKITYNGRY
ncbi:hypothetical protein LLG46_09275 [bacterium]|nr:hypothetical protein [bacterium]